MESPPTPVTFHTLLYHRISCSILELYTFYASVLAPLPMLETLMQKNISWMKEVLQLLPSQLQNISVSSEELLLFPSFFLSFKMSLFFLLLSVSLEKEMATHSSILTWEIPWTEEPAQLQAYYDVVRIRHNLATKPPLPPWFSMYLSYVLWLYTPICPFFCIFNIEKFYTSRHVEIFYILKTSFFFFLPPFWVVLLGLSFLFQLNF